MRLLGRIAAGAALAFLSACDYGPAVEGGQPSLAMEKLVFGSSKAPGLLVDTHYFELSRTGLRRPDQLKAFFRWRCTQTYLAPRCLIFAWRAGEAPHHQSALLPSETSAEILRYYLDKGTGEEHFFVRKR